MKRILLLLFIGSILATASGAQTLEQSWDTANTMYINGDYNGAIHQYDSILQTGNASHKLYYNLGNAYFKDGKIGKAILYYNKALKIHPSDSDTQHNLTVVSSYVKDKIESVPEFFVKTWFRGLRECLSSNGWAIVSIAMLFVALSLVLLYLLSQRLGVRKIGFYGALAALIICGYAMSAASIERREMVAPTEAIIMSSAVPVKSSPNKASTDIFVLHEGTKVKVVSSLQEWCEISIADGNKGWILASSLEMI